MFRSLEFIGGAGMGIKVGDIVKVNGKLREVIAIEPHQDIKGAFYYNLGDGHVERDVRLHPEAVYTRAEIIELAQRADNSAMDAIAYRVNQLEKYYLASDVFTRDQVITMLRQLHQ